MAAEASSACPWGVSAAVSSSKPSASGNSAGGAGGGSSGSGDMLAAASVARRASSASPSESRRLPTAPPTRPSLTTVSSTTALSISVGWCTSAPAKRSSPERSTWATTTASSPAAAWSTRSAISSADSGMNAHLHVPEPGRCGAMRDVRVLAGLTLSAIGQTVHPPGFRTSDAVEGSPEDGRYARVRRVAQHASEPSVLDLPGDLRPELEVQPLVVDRPTLVRLEVHPLVDVGDECLDRPMPGLEVEVRHAHERHPAPAVCTHRATGPGADLRRSLARGEEAAQDALHHDGLSRGG